MRETLFNWLAPVLPGGACLDPFAGSGALGFEAASRGASRVVLIDGDPLVVRALEASRALLDAQQVDIVCGAVPDCLARIDGCFDVVFLDPPFARPHLLDAALAWLKEGGRLNPGACIYVELPVSGATPAVPASWEAYREKRAGAVVYRLYRYPRD